MVKHSESLDNQPKNYGRRAKVGALVSSIPGVFSGLAVLETISAQPAVAGIEHSASHEAASPAVLIASVNNKLAKLQHDLKSARGHHSIMNAPPVKAYKDTQVHSEIYYIRVPNAANPKHHDMLGITTGPDEKMPIDTTVVIDYESPKKQTYTILHGNVNQDITDPNVVTLSFDQGHNFASYRLAAHKSSLPDGTEYLDNPAQVSHQFSHFFQMADKILQETQ